MWDRSGLGQAVTGGLNSRVILEIRSQCHAMFGVYHKAEQSIVRSSHVKLSILSCRNGFGVAGHYQEEFDA